MIRCPYCGTLQEIVAWLHMNDPILACGHIKQCEPDDTDLVEIWDGLRLLGEYFEMKKKELVGNGVSVDEANILVTEDYIRNPISATELRREIGDCSNRA